jgi:hypothetical protein
MTEHGGPTPLPPLLGCSVNRSRRRLQSDLLPGGGRGGWGRFLLLDRAHCPFDLFGGVSMWVQNGQQNGGCPLLGVRRSESFAEKNVEHAYDPPMIWGDAPSYVRLEPIKRASASSRLFRHDDSAHVEFPVCQLLNGIPRPFEERRQFFGNLPRLGDCGGTVPRKLSRREAEQSLTADRQRIGHHVH